MNIIGICTVCNEEDILEEVLSTCGPLYDHLYLIDCGSDDGSAKLLRDYADRHRNAEYLGAIGRFYAEQVRRHIWNRFRDRYGIRDWWMIQDADEFPEENMADIIKEADGEGADHVFGHHVTFYYTRQEYEHWLAGGCHNYLHDRLRPISQRRRFYRAHCGQIRGFRSLPWLIWNHDTSFPLYFSRPCSRPIIYRHYQYRDPVQIEKRLMTRSRLTLGADIKADNPHWLKSKIDEVLADADDPLIHKWDGAGWISDPAYPGIANRRGPFISFLKYLRAIAYWTCTISSRKESQRFWNEMSASSP